MRTATLTLALALAVGAVPRARAQSPAMLLDRAEFSFTQGRLADSLTDFNQLRDLMPDVAPLLWERGIVLYELGQYGDCAAQFVAYHAQNPTDLDSVAWHFLCVARAESPARARAEMLTGGSDPRVMRADIHAMLAGEAQPDDVLADAALSMPPAEFYAHLYIGLYLEVLGDTDGALAHLTEAASPRYQDDGGFMNAVAQVHLAGLKRRLSHAPPEK